MKTASVPVITAEALFERITLVGLGDVMKRAAQNDTTREASGVRPVPQPAGPRAHFVRDGGMRL